MARMLRTLGAVDACYADSKAIVNAAKKLRGKSVLEWVARRATDAQRLDGVIVVTRSQLEYRFVVQLVPLDIPVVAPDEADALACWAAAVEQYSADAIVRIGTECPFLDPALVDRLVTLAESQPDLDYATYCCRDGRPAVLAPIGLYAEWVRRDALLTAARRARSRADRQHPTRFIYSHPERFRILRIPVPEEIDRDDVRLRVDLEEDWEHMETICEALGQEQIDMQRIARLLVHHPHMRERMADLNRTHTMH